MAFSVLFGLGLWEAGRSMGEMDPERTVRLRVGDDVGSSSNNSQSSRSSSRSGVGKTPPKIFPTPA